MLALHLIGARFYKWFCVKCLRTKMRFTLNILSFVEKNSVWLNFKRML